jgi:hypothetical protein
VIYCQLRAASSYIGSWTDHTLGVSKKQSFSWSNANTPGEAAESGKNIDGTGFGCNSHSRGTAKYVKRTQCIVKDAHTIAVI